VLGGLGLAGIWLYLVFRGMLLLAGVTPRSSVRSQGTARTFLRVAAALVLGCLWTIPAGVAIVRVPSLPALPAACQIAASLPATALFPVCCWR